MEERQRRLAASADAGVPTPPARPLLVDMLLEAFGGGRADFAQFVDAGLGWSGRQQIIVAGGCCISIVVVGALSRRISHVMLT
mmetsp:Transcript_48014/g.126760  ORF Transcript_48014/g.126760 Transcript_48014/m.126760 type:complete len:83 (+) Transcript_48014:1-249(+)